MFLKKSFKAISATLALLVIMTAATLAAPVKLTIMHINDFHGRLESFTVENGKPAVGGISRIATIVKQTREKNPNLLLLCAGDAVHGTNLANFDKGQTVVELLGQIGFSALTLGNHEFNFGMDQLLALSNKGNEYDLKFLAADVKSEFGFNPFASAREITVGGLKIAVIGVTTPDTPILTHPDNVKGYIFPNPVEVVSKYVNIFRNDADLVVVLSHAGVEVDKEIAAKVPGIDVIVGGHTHTKLDAGVKVGNTLIVQANEYGQYVGKVDLEVENKKVVSSSASLIPVTADIAEDSEIAKVISERKTKVDAALSDVIGKTAVALDGARSNVRTKETNLGNLVADIIRTAGKADIAVTNGGGIRDSIDVGDITLAEIFKVLPFDNTLATVRVTGEQLVKAIENAVAGYPGEVGQFAQVSGMSYTFNPSLPVGQRVVSVTVGGSPLDLKKSYTVATNDFMAAGGDGYTVFKDAEKVLVGNQFLRELATDYIRTSGTISPAVEGRITIVK